MSEISTVTRFWLYFTFAVIHTLQIIYIISSSYFGDTTIYESYGVPSWVVWIIGVLSAFLMLSNIGLTIKQYRLIKFGVKSTWNN